MFGELVIAYLFLGGAGAGAVCVLGVLEIANARRRFGTGRMPHGVCRTRIVQALETPDEVFAAGWTLAIVILAAAILCLMGDLGRLDRLLNLVFSARATAIAIGAYALVGSIAVAAAMAVLSWSDNAEPSRTAIVLLTLVGTACSIVTMVYTGVLLSQLASVLAWQTPLLPALFTLSSLSCGFALIMATLAFVEADGTAAARIARLISVVDRIAIACEAFVLVAFFTWMSGGEGTSIAAEALVSGSLAPWFWGLVGIGLVGGFIAECLSHPGNWRSLLLSAAACVLFGGFVLRFCVVGLAAFDATQMGIGFGWW